MARIKEEVRCASGCDKCKKTCKVMTAIEQKYRVEIVSCPRKNK
jgi:hypothetical protein